MKYKRIGHYKYELTEVFQLDTGIRVDRAYAAPLGGTLATDWFVVLASNGNLLLNVGYAWDGASGPALDTSSIMRASLVHDGFYQLMRESGLDPSYRKPADKLLRSMCREDGMTWVLAWGVYWGVRIGGRGAASGN